MDFGRLEALGVNIAEMLLILDFLGISYKQVSAPSPPPPLAAHTPQIRLGAA